MPRRILDAIQDAAVLSFAGWTLLYSLGLATQWSLWPSGWLWVVATVVVVVWRVAAAVRDPRSDNRAHRADPTSAAGPHAGPDDSPDAGLSDGRARAALVVGLLATALAGLGGLVWQPRFFAPTFAATLLGVLALLVARHLRGWTPVEGRRDGDGRADATAYGARGLLEDAGALVVALGVSVASLFIHLADTDDPYYLNRAVWVAEHGNAALRDTMFSPEVFNSPYGGGVPIASIEALFGVIAHMTGTLAGTVTYLVATPVASALAVWALWRLARAWAPRRAFLVFLGAVVFLLLSGDSMLGNFWIVRIWQGKVIAVAFLIPLIWACLTDLHEARTARERRWTTFLLLAAGVSLAGLTPTAVIWGPVLLGAVLLAALVLRSRPLAVGGVAVAVGPLVAGAVVVLFSTGVGGAEPVARTAEDSFRFVLGDVGPMVALVLVVLALAPLLARRGAPAALAGFSALGSVAAFSPGVLPLVNAVTGSGPILWRFLYCAPIPILVGLLLSLPVPRLGTSPGPARSDDTAGSTTGSAAERLVPVAGAVVLVLALVAGGRPIWSHTGHGGPVSVSDRPQWKLDVGALQDVRLLARRGPEGDVLLPPTRMKVLSMYTTDFFPLVPRDWFIRQIHEPKKDRKARKLLYDVAAAEAPLPSPQKVDDALARLDVTLACTGRSPRRAKVVDLYAAAGYTKVEQVGTMACTTRPGA
jgi:hypothetical protein